MIGTVMCYCVLSKCTGDSAENIRLVYLLAAFPIFVAVALIHFGINEPRDIMRLKDRKGFPIKKSDVCQLGRNFWGYIGVCFIFMCSRYSEAFLALRAQEMGLELRYVPLILAMMFLFNAPTTRIVGAWSDRRERKIFLAVGFCMMMASCLILALATEIWHVVAGVAIYGIHYGATQGTFYAIVADYSPPQIKGTSIGIFSLMYCVGSCISNVVTGKLWTIYGAYEALMLNAAIAFIAAICIMFVKPNKAKTVEVK
jgi:MFS family permease